MSEINIISRNNFINNSLGHAAFYGIPIPRLTLKFNRNYWDDLIGFGPKLIFGLYFIFTHIPIPLFCITADWRPALFPHDIPIPEVP